MRRWAIIGTQVDKRARGFVDACRRVTGQTPQWMHWRDVIANPRLLTTLGPEDVLRIESPGRDASVWQALLPDQPSSQEWDDGRWVAGRRRFAALEAFLGEIDRLQRSVGFGFLTPPGDLVRMGDKERCRETLAAAGVPLPPALPAPTPTTATELFSAMDRAEWTRVFIKPRWGSSGAGVLALARSSDGRRAVLTTTLSATSTPGGLIAHNSKRLRRYEDLGLITAIIDLILADGAVVERWIPKLTTAGGPVDVRVVVVNGCARHRIARVGRGPITNLHLDSRRLEFNELMKRGPAGASDRILSVAESVGCAFRHAWYFGVDLLVTRGLRQCYVGEVNGWGDLLPGLLHDGEDTFTTEVRVYCIAKPTAA